MNSRKQHYRSGALAKFKESGFYKEDEAAIRKTEESTQISRDSELEIGLESLILGDMIERIKVEDDFIRKCKEEEQRLVKNHILGMVFGQEQKEENLKILKKAHRKMNMKKKVVGKDFNKYAKLMASVEGPLLSNRSMRPKKLKELD